MKRTLVAIAAFALAVAFTPAALAAPGAKPDPKPKPPKLTTVKLLAFNDFHGHLEAGTPGTIIDPVNRRSGHRRRRRVLRHAPEGPRLRERRHVCRRRR